MQEDNLSIFEDFHLIRKEERVDAAMVTRSTPQPLSVAVQLSLLAVAVQQQQLNRRQILAILIRAKTECAQIQKQTRAYQVHSFVFAILTGVVNFVIFLL